MDEKQWITAIIKGDRKAFVLLVETYESRVLNTCFRFLLNKEDAEDTAQEVFTEVYRSISYFKGESSLSTWVIRIAVTKSLDEIRRRKRLKRFGQIGKLFLSDEIGESIATDKKTDGALLEKEYLQQLEQILSVLPDNQRIAFTLSKIDGFSNPEIANIMQTTIEAVESLQYRAKKSTADAIKKLLNK